LAFDRGTKAPLYAVAGICEYWLVDITAHEV
jgi:Uma2 family endonuclease